MRIEVLSVDTRKFDDGETSTTVQVRGLFTLRLYVERGGTRIQAPRMGKQALIAEGSLIEACPSVPGVYEVEEPKVTATKGGGK